MKFKIRKVSDWNYEKEIEINTLQDLNDLYKKYDCELIVSFDDNYITIYDGSFE